MSCGGAGRSARLTSARTAPPTSPQHVAWLWRELPVPVIAAVHGVAFGGGFQIMLGADIRYRRARHASFSVMEIKWGLVPDMAGTQLMRHLVRDDVVRELTYTGRISAPRKASATAASRASSPDPHAAAMALAREIAAKSPDAIRGAKRLYNQALEHDARDPVARRKPRAAGADRHPNQMEAVMANLAEARPGLPRRR